MLERERGNSGDGVKGEINESGVEMFYALMTITQRGTLDYVVIKGL